MTRKRTDIIAGVVLFALSGLLFIIAGYMPTRQGSVQALNTGFYPRMLAVIMAVLSVLLVLETVRKQGQDGQKTAPWWKTKSAFTMFLATLVLLVLYPFVMKLFGFATASFLFITTLIWLLTEKGQAKPVKILGIAVAITVVVYIVFKLVLAIPFPMGLLI